MIETFSTIYYAEFTLPGEPEPVEMSGTLEYTLHGSQPATLYDDGCAGHIEFVSYEREDGELIEEKDLPGNWRGYIEDNGPHLEYFDDLRGYTDEL